MKQCRQDTPFHALMITYDSFEVIHRIQTCVHDIEACPAFINLAFNDYINKKTKEVDLNYQLKGTPFQIKVWETLKHIPLGDQWTYQALAVYIGKPKAYRAVGNALHQNPVPLILPCHRVIGSNGNLRGFNLGINVQQQLIKEEQLKK